MGARYDAIQQIVRRSIPAERKSLEIKRLKAAEHRKAIEALSLPRLVELSAKRAVTIETLRAVPEDDYLEIVISWTKDGVPRPFSNPWRIVNPPLLVPDPAGDVEIPSQDIDGNPQVERFREDPLAVLVDLMERKLK